MIDVNAYLARTYGPQPCWELVADVYARERGAIAVGYKTINRSVREMAGAFRLALHKDPHGFAQIPAPAELCIVLLGKSARIGVHHCGVMVAGKVLHAHPGMVRHDELASLRDQFGLVEFWAKAAP